MQMCGLNPAPGRFLKFLSILVLESMASTAFGMAIGIHYLLLVYVLYATI